MPIRSPMPLDSASAAMHLSKFTDYAIRSCLYLAVRPTVLTPIGEIARAHQIPMSSVMKVVNQLVEGGILSSTRGRSGGVELARPAAEISLGQIVRLMEKDEPMVDCATCRIGGACGVVHGLAVARAAFYASLDGVSLEQGLRAHPRTAPILLAQAERVERGETE